MVFFVLLRRYLDNRVSFLGEGRGFVFFLLSIFGEVASINVTLSREIWDEILVGCASCHCGKKLV